MTIKEKGVLALWKGLGAEIPRGIAMNSAMMTTRELMAVRFSPFLHFFQQFFSYFRLHSQHILAF